jgi:hypothetical protein
MEWSVPLAGGPVEPLTVDPAEPLADEPSPPPQSGFDWIVLACFVVILLAVCWQNWWLARRAEGASLLPDWLRSRSARADAERRAED